MTVALQMAGRMPSCSGVTGKSEIPLDKKKRGCLKGANSKVTFQVFESVDPKLSTGNVTDMTRGGAVR